MNRRQAIAALAATATLPSWTFASTANSAAVADDLRIIREALKMHPGLYRYSTPGEWRARFSRFEQRFAAAWTIDARYLILSRLMASIRCGHSYCNFYNQSDSVAARLFDRPTRLPFHFRWIDGRMIVLRDAGGNGIAPGTEVARINGIPAAELLAALLPYARADGHNDRKRISLLGVEGFDRIETFDVFHGLIYGAPNRGRHRLDLIDSNGRRRQTSVRAIGLQERQAQMPQRDYRGDRPVWTWSMGSDGIALLTMPGWALYDSKWNWKPWLDERLDSLSSARGLIIDLRDNEGGEDIGDHILARLIDQPLVEPFARRLVRYVRTDPKLDPYLDTWDQSFRTLGVGAAPAGDGFLALTGEKADDTVLPAGKPLRLPVAALIGPVNSSATFQFASKARRSGRVRLFGETTGGNQRGINGGRYFFVRLPASGLEFDLPLIGYYPPGSPPDAGIDPDVRVAANRLDIAAGRDPGLVAARQWIGQPRP